MSTGPHPGLVTDYDGSARRAPLFQLWVEKWAACDDQVSQALCSGQVTASNSAASYIDEAIVAAFDLWDQYEAARRPGRRGGHGRVPRAGTGGLTCWRAERPVAMTGVPGAIHACEGDMGSTLRLRTRRRCAGCGRSAAQLDGLRHLACASQGSQGIRQGRRARPARRRRGSRRDRVRRRRRADRRRGAGVHHTRRSDGGPD
jgi:hypothetical protein